MMFCVWMWYFSKSFFNMLRLHLALFIYCQEHPNCLSCGQTSRIRWKQLHTLSWPSTLLCHYKTVGIVANWFTLLLLSNKWCWDLVKFFYTLCKFDKNYIQILLTFDIYFSFHWFLNILSTFFMKNLLSMYVNLTCELQPPKCTGLTTFQDIFIS